jgi:hypothetical protein
MLRKALASAFAVSLAGGAMAAELGDAAARDAQLRALQDQRRAQVQHPLEPSLNVPVLQLAPPSGLRRDPVPDEQPCRVIHALQWTGPHAARFHWASREFESFAGRCLGPRSLQAQSFQGLFSRACLSTLAVET